jgi:NAD(P)-dependent dehydrogenase (short-subunit alcohol dehydrogenase family)/3-oxoacyl-(acyl-carrier-protein) synthase
LTPAAKPLAGKVVLVTGGARGLGKEISRAFAGQGAHVIVNYFHASTEAPSLLTELNQTGSAELLRGSVAVHKQVDAMFDTIEARHGRLDVLVNNAAAGALLPLDDLDESHWDRAFDTNLRGSLWCARRAAPLMPGDGAIVNLSSVGSSLVISDYATVGTSKAAVEALTRYLAVEFAGTGIRVNTASGGLLDGAVAGLFPGHELLARRVRDATPLGHRLGKESELAELVLFLASPAASWITGQTVVADGGLSLGATMLSSAPAGPSTQDSAESGGDNETTVVIEKITARVPALTRPPVADPAAAIAIVGMGVVTPGANTPEELWHTLHGEKHVFTEPVLFDINAFHSDDPGAEDRTYTRKSGFITDFVPHPLLRAELDDNTVPSRESTALWLRHSIYTALADVGTRDGDRYFAAVGYTADGSQELEERLVLSGYLAKLGNSAGKVADLLRERYDRLRSSSYEFLPHRIGRNAITGPLPDTTELLMVDSACSSSLYSVDLGVKALREGTSDIAVCGGAFAYSARNLVLFSKLHGLSKSGEVRSFDRTANGVLFSDGAGAVVLKRLDRAQADGDTVLGIVDGVGLSCDGKGKSIYAPNSDGQVIALKRAYADSGADPASVRWVIGHATGTQAGDTAELTSLHQVAGTGPAALLSSNKPIIGHTGWTAGVVSLVHALLGLRHNTVPAQRYLREPIAALDDSRFTPPVSQAALPPGPGRRVAVSSFGFGGTNAHLVLTDVLTDAARDRVPADGPVPPEDDVVVVGWATDLPELTGQDAVARWLRGEGPGPADGFGEQYPLPGFGELRLPPATMRNMDRTQIMVLRAAARLGDPVRELCARLHDTTGVVVGHMGPTRRAVHYALRCYLGDLRRCLDEHLTDPAVAADIEALTTVVRAQVPPSTEDAFPGIMPNIIAARLAAHADYHGLNLTVDTGPDSALDAIRTAERYLRHGDLRVALVAGINGNTTPELAELLASGPPTAAPAEGAFLAVLTQASTAREHGLPILARLRTRLGQTDPRTRPGARSPLATKERSYLGADAMVALLSLLAEGTATATVGSASPYGPQLDVTAETAVAAPPVTRVAHTLVPAEARVIRPALPAIPDGALVIVADSLLLKGINVPYSARVVVAPAVLSGAPLPDPAQLDALMTGTTAHVRVIAEIGVSGTAPDDLSAVDGLRVLHDLAYLAAARWSAAAGASFAVLLTGSVRDGVPHPATGLFTGLVKSLAREQPTALAYAVLTDTTGATALTLLETESACRLDLFVAVHAGGRRHEYDLADAPVTRAAPLALGSGSVVVAAGGTRGLTAELLAALATSAKPTIYLLGRRAPAHDTALGSRAEFLTAHRAGGKPGSIAGLSADYDRLVAATDTRRTLDRLAALCGPGRIHHLVCDLTDPAAVHAAIDRIHHAHERVDLLINAAGVHQGGTLASTPLTVARHVRDTKLLAYLNLRAAFAGRLPARWHNFGSLLAVLGWPGEAAYCAANDLLNTAAAWHHHRGVGDETTVAWTLWDEAGFAAEPLTRALLRGQGALTGLSNEDGRALYLAELATPGTQPTVTFLGTAERGLLAGPARTPRLTARPGSAHDLSWAPGLEHEEYLRHHLLNGVPTLPAALITELAVLAAAGEDGRVPTALRNARFSFPVTVTGSSPGRSYHLRRTGATTRLLSNLVAPNGTMLRTDMSHAEVDVVFGDARTPVRQPVPAPSGSETTPDYYTPGGQILLSGPFASLGRVRVEPFQATAMFSASLSGTDAVVFGDLRIPALLLDSLLQLTLLAGHTNAEPGTPLPVPVGVRRVDLLTEHNDVELLNRYGDTIHLTADTRSGTAVAQAPDGTLLLRVHGVQASTPAGRPRAAAEMGTR